MSFGQFLREKRGTAALFAAFAAVFAGTFALYHVPPAVVLYPALLCLTLGAAALGWSYRRALLRHRERESLLQIPAETVEDMLPEVRTSADADYQAVIRALCQGQRALTEAAEQSAQEMMDYYTAWAHQIKTPIASMQLRLQAEDSELSRQLKTDLGRIEQYAEMVMTYLRVDSESTDYRFEPVDLDKVVRENLRRLRGDFILRKLRLNYEPLQATAVTDEKWLSFVVGQVLSNALKYTREGSISIWVEAPLTLCIRDTGIGIAAEDLPRIFEKGYTGAAGRTDKKASGLGLYLCRRICDGLGSTLRIESEVNVGTTVRIGLDKVRRSE